MTNFSTHKMLHIAVTSFI